MAHSIGYSWLLAISIGVSANALATDATDEREHSVAKNRIDAEHQAAMAACDKVVDSSTDAHALQSNDKDSLEMAARAFQGSPHAKEICVATADGKKKIATAQLEYQRSASDENAAKVEAAKIDAARDIAKLKCADQAADAHDACVTEWLAKNPSPG